MRELLRRTWAPALLFAISAFLTEVLILHKHYRGGRPASLPVGVVTLYVLVVVLPVWWGTTLCGRIDAARGALSGAVCGAALLLPPLVVLVVNLATNRNEGLGGVAAVGIVSLILSSAFSVVAVGAVIGLLAALLQRVNATERGS